MDERILQNLRSQANGLIAASGFRQPPVNPLLIGARHDVYFMVRPMLNGAQGYKALQHGDSWVITVDASLSPEEQQLTAAQAVVEALFKFPPPEEADPGQVAAAGAAELLMPVDWFQEAISLYGFDLPALKRKFATGYEATAWRMIDFRPSVLTIFENDQVVLRGGSEHLVYPAKPTTVERAVAARCLEEWSYQRGSDERWTVECHPTTQERGLRRVICFAIPKG